MNNLIAIHPAVWATELTPDNATAIADRAAELGYHRVVVPLRTPETIDADAFGKALRNTGVRPVNTANQLPDADLSSVDPVVRERGRDRLRLAVKLARDMGSDHVGGVLYGPLRHAPAQPDDDVRRTAAESLAVVADEAKAAGVRLVLEIVNRYETNLLNTAAAAVSFVEEAGSDNLFLHLDTYHMNIEEPDLDAAVRLALPHLAYLELGQNDRGDLTRGHVPVRAVLAAALAAGYRGTIGVEAFTRELMTTPVATSLAIWRDVFDDGDALARAAAGLVRDVLAGRVALG
ncbi:sugar phosphate isomerase/epimerase family protein [Actinophytocola sp. NPDC049390]|uniref:sugar phosphate isomerase/epimerase family protein n=1 Tax=Actinophytocola sp. NPDC049390 TaxID=3363894 RepID=UPI0037B177B8